MSMTTNGCLRSGELARSAGVSTDTLRHYERKGLLIAERSPNGYREFLPDALARVRLIQQALSVGFALDELATFLKVRDQGGAPCHQVRALAAKKLEDLDERIAALTALRGNLAAMLEDWDTRLAGAKNGGRAWLLESLVHGGSSTHPKRSPLPAGLHKGERK
jgi:DNA-binding transcriptional MerR regulator